HFSGSERVILQFNTVQTPRFPGFRHTPPEVIYHRISASARRPTLLAPLWCENRWTGMVELDRYLNEHGVQGSALERPWIPPTE
ncbi:hypothetical protein ACUOA8_28530, partial [Escherichia sp. SS-MK2]